MSRPLFTVFALAALGAGASDLSAEPTRLLRRPAVSATRIAFAYAGDIWVVGRDGGQARRLTATEAPENDPRFSPDGSLVAYSGEEDGNLDVYVVPAEGGSPSRLTWHPGDDRVRGWTNDGRRVIFGSARTAAPSPYTCLWTVPLEGGLPDPLPIPRAFAGQFSPDARRFAYTDHALAIVDDIDGYSQWRNYRGGRVSPIRVIDLGDLSVTKLPWDNSNDTEPMWMGDTIYFLSDRDLAVNLYAWTTPSGPLRQITHHRDFDIMSASAGGGVVVYEQAGWIHLYDPATDQDHRVEIEVRGDLPWTRPRWIEAAESFENGSLSPAGARAVFEAHGDIITVPAEKGDWRNLTQSPGAADRDPVWSPDGRSIAWFSDASGEYRLMIGDQKGAEKPREIALEHPTFYYTPSWSPDSKHLAFTDTGLNIWLVEVASGRATKIDRDSYTHDTRTIDPVWSPDSRWVAYAKRLDNQFHVLTVYSLDQRSAFTITDGLSDSVSPAWDASGKYLYFLASTDFGLNTGWVDMSSFERPVRRAIYLAVLKKGEPSPLLPESDEEPGDKGDGADKSRTPGKDGKDKKDGGKAKEDEGKEEGSATVTVEIDVAGIDQRIVALGVPPRDYTRLAAGAEGILFFAETVPNQERATLHRYDLKEREGKPFLEGIDRFAVSHDGGKLLYRAGEQWGIVKTDDSPKVGDGEIATDEIRILVDPRSEWRQIYREAWRFHRDYFYDSGMHGSDWRAIHDKYLPFLDEVAHRTDLSYLLATVAGELSVGHSFVFGPEDPHADERPHTGLLGADLEVDRGRYRIGKIYTGENWNPGLRAPLSAPGIEVKEGDYILEVNGVELRAPTEPYSLFTGTAGRQTTLRISGTPDAQGSRLVTVTPVESEEALRARAWVEGNRRRVEQLSGGRLAYVYLPDTGEGGYTYFNRYYFSRQDKAGAVLDERFNGGGSVADYMVDIMGRRILGFFNNPADPNRPFTVPGAGLFGPKVMIINESAGSGGDFLPYLFRMAGLGPLVGTRTWGGLVGIWDFPPLMDGGVVTVPRGGFYNLKGAWDVENAGVAPDIEVEQTPREMAGGHDPQLERAVAEALKLVEAGGGERRLPQPPSPKRVLRPGS